MCYFKNVTTLSIASEAQYINEGSTQGLMRQSFNAFNIFIPSLRKTLFFQKKIKLFNVEFIVLHVSAQM